VFLITSEDDLRRHLERFHTAPFLFVGSGFTRRYAGTEDWVELLSSLAALTPKPYARYASQANGDLPAIASAIAEDFHDVWWEGNEFQAQRQAFPQPKTRASPMKAVSRRVW
jgi:hypothetical protein